MCDLGKDATTHLESSSIIADADYLINVLVQAGGDQLGGRICIDFQESLVSKPKSLQKQNHAYLTPMACWGVGGERD